MTLQFVPAVKIDSKARVALIGPSGSGKTKTGLILAEALAGPEGKICAIDTERGSMRKYADKHKFNVMELDEFSPATFDAAMDAAEAGPFSVLLIDSLSHFWVGKSGALEFVDNAAATNRARGNSDGMSGWKDFRPHERKMIDRMTGSRLHIIVTMRTKTDYQETTNERGKKVRVKIGLAPVQREGLEYEFDLVGYMDDKNNFLTDKTRCEDFADKVIHKPSAKDFQPFLDWLHGATEMPESMLVDFRASIETADDLPTLRTRYETAYSAAERFRDTAARKKIEGWKDIRKKTLETPATQAKQA